MVDIKYPNVTVNTAIRMLDTGDAVTGLPRSVIVGRLNKGPEVPTTVRSWSEFQRIFGGYGENQYTEDQGGGVVLSKTSHMVDGAFLFFANSPSTTNSQLIVVRVPGKGAAAATTADLAGTDSTPVVLTATSTGEWANSYCVRVSEAKEPGRTGTYLIEVGTVGSTKRSGPVIGTVVERFVVSLDPNAGNYVNRVLNNSAIVKVDFRPEVGKTNTLALATVALGGGLNEEDGETTEVGWGGIPGADALLSSDGTSGQLSLLDDLNGSFTIASPGVVNGEAQGVLNAWATNRADSFAVLDADNVAPDQAMDVSPTGLGAGFSACYYPWIEVVDPVQSTSIRNTRTMPPSGAVLAAFSVNDSKYGVWKSPAGTNTRINALRPSYRLSEAQMSKLHENSINVIRRVNGTGVCVMGARTLSGSFDADKYISVRRSLSYITSSLKRLTEFALFQPNGPDLWEEITVRVQNWLGLYFQAGALRGAREPEAFYVKCSRENNSPLSIQLGEVHIEVGVAVEFPAEFVVIDLIQYQTDVKI